MSIEDILQRRLRPKSAADTESSCFDPTGIVEFGHVPLPESHPHIVLASIRYRHYTN